MSAFSTTKMQINRKWKVAVNLVLGDEYDSEKEPDTKIPEIKPEIKLEKQPTTAKRHSIFPTSAKRHSIFPEAFTQDMARRFREYLPDFCLNIVKI